MEHCGWYAHAVDLYLQCDGPSQADKDAAHAELAAKQATLVDYESMSDDERIAIDQACWDAFGTTLERSSAAGCPAWEHY